MKTILKHKDAEVTVEKIGDGENKISVELLNQELFMPINSCQTSYPLDLIKQILYLKGPAYLCDEILRDESADYTQKEIEYNILAHLSEEEFKNKKILDFGCGSGASTMILARMFPEAEIVGVEMEKEFISIARLRAQHYGYQNVKFILSPEANSLPKEIGKFDYVMLSAVYEHLLPEERKSLLPKVWGLLENGGVMFINETPNKNFPIEVHTTKLPLINYLPAKLAFFMACKLRPGLENESWQSLLRKGIRGGTLREILKILNKQPGMANLLKPNRLGIKNRIDLWYRSSSATEKIGIKKITKAVIRFINLAFCIVLVPSLSLAIKKEK